MTTCDLTPNMADMTPKTDMMRARQRAVALGYHSVTELIAARLNAHRNSPEVSGVRNMLSRGLGTRRSMLAAARLFSVPPTFWLEADPERVRSMIAAPATTTPATAA